MKSYQTHLKELKGCRLCPDMEGRPVAGCVAESRIIHIGQAPGPHEEKFQKPFAWTAGKTLFQWLGRVGIQEEIYRQRVNMSAVCRCYPGKGGKSGDRKPTRQEKENCSRYLEFEFQHHKPDLVIPIGRVAIELLLKNFKLRDVVGLLHRGELYGVEFDWIALPHPSGLNTWNHTEEGKRGIAASLELLASHPAVREELLREG